MDLVSCMVMMMSMMVNLSNKVNLLEQLTQVPAAPDHVSSVEPLHDPKNTSRQAAPPQDPKQEEAVQRWVEQHLQQIPLLQGTKSQEDRSSEEEAVVKRKKRTPKSGRDYTGAMSVKKRITWPHEVIYGADGHPTTYKELTVSSFIKGYLIVLKDVQVSEVK